jgi:hypothetical protein
MGKIKGFASALAAIGLLAATPVTASNGNDAEKLRRLDIMLMVTGLRCRNTADNFQPDYQRFTARHIAALNAASDELKAHFATRMGPVQANRAVDRISVTMANSYGQGHPWLSCAELKVAARGLANAQGTAVLLEAADQLLAGSGTPRFAWAR